MRRLLAVFNPELPRVAWYLQAGIFVNFLGNGMVAPFLVIYLHYGRHIPLAVAGSAVALGGIVAVVSGLAAGSLVDRIGPRHILVLAMTCNAAAYLLYTAVGEPWQAFAVGLLVGVGTGAYGPSSQSMTAALVGPDRRSAAFAQNRVSAMVGLGLGATIGGLIAAAGLSGYIRLLQLDALTFVVFAGMAMFLPAVRAPAAAGARGGYAQVLRDRPFRRLVALNLTLVSAGIAPMLVLVPAYAKGQSGVGEQAIGLIFAVNTLTIVVLQMPLTRFAQGRARMAVLRLGALAWVGFWFVCLAVGLFASGQVAAVVFALGVVAYSAGECLYTATVLPTATALSPEHLRGRYLGAVGLSWQAGFLIGPSLGGVLLGWAPLAFPVACGAGCVAAAFMTQAVDRALGEAVKRAPVALAAR